MRKPSRPQMAIVQALADLGRAATVDEIHGAIERRHGWQAPLPKGTTWKAVWLYGLVTTDQDEPANYDRPRTERVYALTEDGREAARRYGPCLHPAEQRAEIHVGRGFPFHWHVFQCRCGKVLVLNNIELAGLDGQESAYSIPGDAERAAIAEEDAATGAELDAEAAAELAAADVEWCPDPRCQLDAGHVERGEKHYAAGAEPWTDPYPPLDGPDALAALLSERPV